MKRCRRCEEVLPAWDFRAKPVNKDGLDSYCKPCRKIRNKEWNVANPERYAAIQRRAGLKAHYGITSEQYDALLAAQDGKCAICQSSESNGRSAHFHVDHDHGTGEMRGLLCASCNVGIGHFREDPQLLVRALAYLRR